MEQRINSPFKLPRKWDNRKIAHSYDHPVFAVTHKTLKGTLAAVLLHTPTNAAVRSQHATEKMLTMALTSLIFNTHWIILPVIYTNQHLSLQLPSKSRRLSLPQVLIPAGCGCLLLLSKENQWRCMHVQPKMSMKGTKPWFSLHLKEEGNTTWLITSAA